MCQYHAAQRSVELAEEAGRKGTFAVGGVLVDRHGKVRFEERNRVLVDGFVNDPTAHGERQIINWYFANKDALKLPEPEELAVVTSLDPCVMCTGAILASGMGVMVVAHDDQAGIGYTLKGDFPSVPGEIRPLALDHFSYFGVEGDRLFKGGASSFALGQDIPAALESRSITAFLDSLEATRKVVSAETGSPLDLRAGDAKAKAALAILREHDCDAGKVVVNPVRPEPALVELLLKRAGEAASADGIFDSAALVDRFGTVLLSVGNQQKVVPTNTPYMLLTRAYAKARRECHAQGLVLPHPKQCRIVLLQGPGRDATGLMDLGAYGSTMEGPLPEDNARNLVYIVPRQTPEQLDAMVKALPPFYSQVVGVAPVQLDDPEMVARCTAALATSTAGHTRKAVKAPSTV